MKKCWVWHRLSGQHMSSYMKNALEAFNLTIKKEIWIRYCESGGSSVIVSFCTELFEYPFRIRKGYFKEFSGLKTTNNIFFFDEVSALCSKCTGVVPHNVADKDNDLCLPTSANEVQALWEKEFGGKREEDGPTPTDLLTVLRRSIVDRPKFLADTEEVIVSRQFGIEWSNGVPSTTYENYIYLGEKEMFGLLNRFFHLPTESTFQTKLEDALKAFSGRPRPFFEYLFINLCVSLRKIHQDDPELQTMIFSILEKRL
eukprot:TRINITY_DN3337_c0_g1_i1.p1 TRINITY_DN3337_c0_g1~~TRINITY_DN3337_c0_g1_i1.p1  ORF type:complete len:257 (-),score=51.64 TRINITY_DN3337_c0_g1_i1:459-1229(-)